jgi:hypothetical protein
MHKIIRNFLFIGLALFTSSSFARTISSDRVVEYIRRQAQISATFSDFVKLSAPTPKARDEMMKYLTETDLANERMPEFYAYASSFVVDAGDDISVTFELGLTPRPHYLVFHRVVYLDRPIDEIAKELNNVFRSEMASHSAIDLVLPKAHAQLGLISSWGQGMAVAGKASASQVEAAAAAGPIAPAQTPIGDDVEELRKNVEALKYSFKCEDPKMFGFNKARITMPEKETIRFFSVEQPFNESADKFTLKASSLENWDPIRCSYQFENGVATASNSKTFCGDLKLRISQSEANEVAKKEAADAKKAEIAAAKAAGKKVSAAKVSKTVIPKPSQLKLADIVAPRGVALSRVISCCAKDPVNCANQVLQKSGTSPQQQSSKPAKTTI